MKSLQVPLKGPDNKSHLKIRKRRLISGKVAKRKDYPYRQFLCDTHLRFEKQIEESGSRYDKIREIWWYTFYEFKAAKEKKSHCTKIYKFV